MRSSKGRLKISWKSTTLAKKHLVEIAVADGRRLRLMPKARSVSVPGVAKTERVTVKVRGVDRLVRSGPVATARRGGR